MYIAMFIEIVMLIYIVYETIMRYKEKDKQGTTAGVFLILFILLCILDCSNII